MNKYNLKTPFYTLAPMANITTYPFASQAIKYGADLVWTPMVHTDTIINNWPEAEKILNFKEIKNYIAQIVGSNPENFAQAVKIIEENLNPIGFDLNRACPDKNIVKSGCGGSLMQRPELMFAIVKAVKEATQKPVSVKTRLGWESKEEILGLLPGFAELGIGMLTVHGRTVREAFRGQADWGMLAKIRLQLNKLDPNLLLVGSGDITTWQEAINAQEKTKVDGVMIGRGALGRPWIFEEIKAKEDIHPDLNIIKKLAKDLAQKSYDIWGEHSITESKKHFAWYFKGTHESAEYRRRLMGVKSLSDVDSVLN
jgi:nifR3 family TIM-barrel protein